MNRGCVMGVAAMLLMVGLLASMPAVKAEETTVGTFVIVQDGQAYYFDIVTTDGKPVATNAQSIPAGMLNFDVNEGVVYLIGPDGLVVKPIHIDFGFVKKYVVFQYQYPNDSDPDTPEYYVKVWYGYYWVSVTGGSVGHIYGYYPEAYGTLVNG